MTIYFAVDEGTGDAAIPLTSTPNCDAAYEDWEARFIRINQYGSRYRSVKDFEGSTNYGGGQDLIQDFIGRAIATIPETSTEFVYNEEASTDGFGRYSIPGDSSGYFLKIGDDVEIVFDRGIGGVSFYLTDVGDYGGTIGIVARGVDNFPINTLSFSIEDMYYARYNQQIFQETVRESNVVFIGLICDSPTELIYSIEIIVNYGSPDIIGLDQLSIGMYEELCTNPSIRSESLGDKVYLSIGNNSGGSSHYVRSFIASGTGSVVLAQTFLELAYYYGITTTLKIKITGAIDNDPSLGPDLTNVYAESTEFTPPLQLLSSYYDIASWTNYSQLIKDEVYFFVLYAPYWGTEEANVFWVFGPSDQEYGPATDFANAFWYSNDNGVTWGYEFGPDCPNKKVFGFNMIICQPPVSNRRVVQIFVTT